MSTTPSESDSQFRRQTLALLNHINAASRELDDNLLTRFARSTAPSVSVGVGRVLREHQCTGNRGVDNTTASPTKRKSVELPEDAGPTTSTKRRKRNTASPISFGDKITTDPWVKDERGCFLRPAAKPSTTAAAAAATTNPPAQARRPPHISPCCGPPSTQTHSPDARHTIKPRGPQLERKEVVRGYLGHVVKEWKSEPWWMNRYFGTEGEGGWCQGGWYQAEEGAKRKETRRVYRAGVKRTAREGGREAVVTA